MCEAKDYPWGTKCAAEEGVPLYQRTRRLLGLIVGLRGDHKVVLREVRVALVFEPQTGRKADVEVILCRAKRKSLLAN